MKERCVGSRKSVCKGDKTCEDGKRKGNVRIAKLNDERRLVGSVCRLSVGRELRAHKKEEGKWGSYCLPLTGPGAGVYIHESETARDSCSSAMAHDVEPVDNEGEQSAATFASKKAKVKWEGEGVEWGAGRLK